MLGRRGFHLQNNSLHFYNSLNDIIVQISFQIVRPYEEAERKLECCSNCLFPERDASKQNSRNAICFLKWLWKFYSESVPSFKVYCKGFNIIMRRQKISRTKNHKNLSEWGIKIWFFKTSKIIRVHAFNSRWFDKI